jgi:hypothetical protein
MRTLIKLIVMIAILPLPTTSKLNASPEEDAKTVSTLDTKYQAAVKANDAVIMDQILADDFVLVTGRGAVLPRLTYSTLLEERKSSTSARTRNLARKRSEYGATQPL